MTSPKSTTRPSMLINQETRQEEARLSALTTEQQTALDIIKSAGDSRLINIHGPSGAGKTFLGWALAQNDDSWSYYPWVPVSPIDGTNVFIDNVAPVRVASRRVRELVDFGDVERAVAISREPVPEIHTSHHLPRYTTE